MTEGRSRRFEAEIDHMPLRGDADDRSYRRVGKAAEGKRMRAPVQAKRRQPKLSAFEAALGDMSAARFSVKRRVGI